MSVIAGQCGRSFWRRHFGHGADGVGPKTGCSSLTPAGFAQGSCQRLGVRMVCLRVLHGMLAGSCIMPVGPPRKEKTPAPPPPLRLGRVPAPRPARGAPPGLPPPGEDEAAGMP